MGNLRSVYNAFDYIAEPVMICTKPKDLYKVNRIVIPGVGAFKDSINKLKESGFIDALNEHVIVQRKPTLGICLGLQLMASKSLEGGEFNGLGWFDATVIKIKTGFNEYKVPNVGWNEIKLLKDSELFDGIPQSSDFYLVHSYYMKCNNPKEILATYSYGEEITAAVLKDNIFATQFHPEKSQEIGLKVLENFSSWIP